MSERDTPIGVSHDVKDRHFKAQTATSLTEDKRRLETAKKQMHLVELIPNTTKFFARSKSDPNKHYQGDFEEGTCECPDHEIRQIKCWHILAAKLKSIGLQNGGHFCGKHNERMVPESKEDGARMICQKCTLQTYTTPCVTPQDNDSGLVDKSLLLGA